MNIGCLGLGNMGGGIARNLLAYCGARGHRLLVFDINPAAMRRLTEHSATAANSVADLAARVEVLFTSLPGAPQINELALGADGILENLPAHATWFETSTNEIPAWQKIVAAADANLTLADAPVTGGAEGAAAGTLTMLLGADARLLERHRELLAAFTDKVLCMGRPGAGYAAKLCQLHLNYLVAQGLGEAMMLGAKAGINLSQLYAALRNSCARSYVVEQYAPMLLDGSYDPSFALGLAARDLRLIEQLGAHLDVELKLGGVVGEEYRNACARYGEDAPHLSVLKLMEEKCGRLLRD